MADTVRVQFSASIGALIKGVEDAKSAINSVKESTDRVTEGAKSLLEAFGLAFSVDRIVEFVGSMAELGEQVERSAAILGVSTKSVQELGFIAKATGGDSESLALSMERLQVNLQKAQSGTGPAAAALAALGLSAKQLIGLSIDEQMNKIADAVSKFADGGNKTAIVMELLGRGGAQMIPVLDQGRAGLDELRNAADQTGAVMSSKTITALSSLERGLVTMKAAATGLGGTLVGELAGAINSATGAITNMIADMNAAISGGVLWQRAMEDIRFAMSELGIEALRLGVVAKDVFTLNWGEITTHWANGEKMLEEDLQAYEKRLEAIMAPAKQAMLDALGGEAGGAGKPQAPASDVGGGGSKVAMEQFQTQIKLADEAYKQTQDRLASEVKLHQISNDEETQSLLEALERRYQVQQAALGEELQIGGLSVAQYQKIVDQKLQLEAKFNVDKAKIEEQGLQADMKAWQSTLAPLQSAFNSQLRGLLSGTTSWSAAMKNVAADLVLDVIKEFEKMAVAKASLNLAGAFGDPAEVIAPILKMITASLGQVFAGASAFFAPMLGPAAPAAAAGVTAVVEGAAVGMAKLDVGAWNIPREGMAMLHPGETVLPATAAQAFRSMAESGSPGGGGGGDTHIHFNVNAIDARSFAGALNDSSSYLYRMIQQGLRNGALKPA